MVSVLWQRALDELQQQGMFIDAREESIVESVRTDFERLSASVQEQPGFEEEATRLAAWMVSYAIERERLGLTEYENF